MELGNRTGTEAAPKSEGVDMNFESHNKHKQQKLHEGYGATYHRIYSIEVEASLEQALKALQEMKIEFNRFSPQILARFEKVKGAAGELKVGDEFQIHITGPWNGPVRVTEVHDKGFRFVTLQGHLEAGEIGFEIKQLGRNKVVFEIESMARSRDAIVDFVYDKIPIAKLAQTEMWICFCRHFAEKTLLQDAAKEKPPVNEVNVLTERYDQEKQKWQTI